MHGQLKLTPPSKLVSVPGRRLAIGLTSTVVIPTISVMRSTVSEKGQVTIPKPLRDRLGIRAGEMLEFHEQDGRLIATKALIQDPVEAVYGILDLRQTTDELVRELRGDGDLG